MSTAATSAPRATGQISNLPPTAPPDPITPAPIAGGVSVTKAAYVITVPGTWTPEPSETDSQKSYRASFSTRVARADHAVLMIASKSTGNKQSTVDAAMQDIHDTDCTDPIWLPDLSLQGERIRGLQCTSDDGGSTVDYAWVHQGRYYALLYQSSSPDPDLAVLRQILGAITYR